MLRDLTRNDWLSILNIPEERIPVALVLRGTRNLKTNYDAYSKHFTNVLEVGTPNGILEDVLIGDIDRKPIAYASVYGANMASEVTHVFGVLGTSVVIQTGCFGVLADGITAGDLLVATEAYCGEGAARYYLPSKDLVAATPDLCDWLLSQGGNQVGLHAGRVYTTAALFAESMEDVENWFRAGYSAADMETATTFAVAEYFGMDRASLLFAFDAPREEEHILLSDAEKDQRRSKGNERMIELALRMAVEKGRRKSV